MTYADGAGELTAKLLKLGQGLALRDGCHRRAAAGIDLFGADHAGRLAGCVLAAGAELGLGFPRHRVGESGLGGGRLRER